MENKKDDHIKIGKELGLFVQSDVVGRGLPLLTPKGATIKRVLCRFIEDEEIKRGYQFTDTPVLAKSGLYKISGHLDHYKESMFVFDAGEEEMVLRPMTCPHQFMIYKSQPHSYRELPIRYAEIASLFRNEQTGEMHGLIRVRQFTLADAHIICLPEQLEEEFEGVINLIQFVMKSLGFEDYWYRFSKWNPKDKEKYIDNPEAWEKSQKMMKKIIDKVGLKYKEAEGEAAFYGPKLDIQMKNVHGKEDTIFTVQIDFALPEKFDMTYEGSDGKKHRPMIIHRSSIGALERTIAMLLEYYQGELPIWLSPVQAKIVTISEKFNDYGKKVLDTLKEKGIRAEIDTSNETLGKKIMGARKEKTPYILVVGEKEETDNTVAVNYRNGDKKTISVEDFTEKILKETKEKK
ncbi:MAG: threonine--tRNA ligase [Candidatus Marinimicrobia bacterium]|nr:threonine--tRNA ligase [Candidatus Neomarinimicrobiota bacterium]